MCSRLRLLLRVSSLHKETEREKESESERERVRVREIERERLNVLWREGSDQSFHRFRKRGNVTSCLELKMAKVLGDVA
jgi:hypothetical protein